MVREGKADELLMRIAEKAGFLCISDLKSVSAPEELFALFLAVEQGAYTREEWNRAIAYIFSLSDYKEFCQSMEIILWNIGTLGIYIADVMKRYLAVRGQVICFHEVAGGCVPCLSEGCRYLVFYRIADASSETRARLFAESRKIPIFFAALCSNYGEGLDAMEKGDCYALSLPLEAKRIINCYEHFNVISYCKEVS